MRGEGRDSGGVALGVIACGKGSDKDRTGHAEPQAPQKPRSHQNEPAAGHCAEMTSMRHASGRLRSMLARRKAALTGHD